MTRILLLSLMAFGTTVTAQWLNYPTPGIPRLPDGKPNLAAPTPKTAEGKPDLSGVWVIDSSIGYSLNAASDLRQDEVMPWAERLFRERQSNLEKDDPFSVRCLPLGPRQFKGGAATLPVKIIQTSALVVILLEDLSYRQIFMDSRPLPRDPNPSFMGYSIGRWEGDTLVIESNGFNATTWLDFGGRPHTESLHITERWHRTDFGHIDLQVTFDDPQAYRRPWTIPATATLLADTDLIEYVCNDNEKSSGHLVGQTEVQKTVTVAPAILAGYAGRYEPVSPTPLTRSIDITVSEDQLWMDIDGKGKILLVPSSEATFAFRFAAVEFAKENQGGMALVTFNGVRFVRKP